MVNFFAFATLLAATVSASSLKWDIHYSFSQDLALTSFACSDGSNGLITTTGAQTVGELKTKLKPGVYIAATPQIVSWNSPNCGKCYRVRNPRTNKSILVVGIDVSRPAAVTGQEGFLAVSQSGLGQGTLNVYFSEVPASNCFA
ncbi:Cerato-platanin [Arthrobotrys entomopaga]|nr:Cerato-platanin [Arthrobotrys entomopaga]